MNPFNLLGKKKCSLRLITPDADAAGLSDKGLVRITNEDKIWMHDSGKVFLLADGMGGHERGAEASSLAVKFLSGLLTPDKIYSSSDDVSVPEKIPSEYRPVYASIQASIRKTAIQMAQKNKELNLTKYMGTTIVGLILADVDYIFWFHVGDSRLYRYRNDNLTRLTVDHSLYAEWEKNGRNGDAPPKHYVTRVIANNPDVAADIGWDKSVEGDIYLLCSDGLSDMISDNEIREVLGMNKTIPAIVKMLVNRALSEGGRDNVSVMAARIL